jgi:UDP-GlcNAc:undecaprenyl-phosphate/decaprenyl-phosphate GlcNAc-1-phosphate transferase
MITLLSQTSPATSVTASPDAAISSPIDLLNSHAHIFVAAFMVTLLVTPLVAKIAQVFGVVDRPDFKRKAHTQPIAYLGGIAVLAGLMVAIGISYVVADSVPASFLPVPIAVVIGMVAITFTGLADDVWGWDPRLKIAGQLVAAAALAIENVGVNVAKGVLDPVFGAGNLVFLAPTPFGDVTIDLVYWLGTGLIAVFVLGGCNSANLIDGLDGLLSGVTGIVAMGLLAISMLMITPASALVGVDHGVLDGARIVLCLALLGAVLGFLPHNFKPATIFLGDCGSLLLGYMCVVIILMLGENGETHLVCAGLIVFAVPIIDTTLAIIRRKLAGTPMSAADDQHLHHQLKRALGGVRRAVLGLYTLSFMFATLGVTLAALVIKTELRVRSIYAIAMVVFGMVGVVAVKAARRHQRAVEANVKAAPPQPAAPAIDSKPPEAAPVNGDLTNLPVNLAPRKA